MLSHKAIFLLFFGTFGSFQMFSADAAEELKLRPGISFSQDLDNGFPIVAEKLDDVSPDAGRPTLIFFGASGDLNTNRQAKRIVDLYRKNADRNIKFVLVDVDNANNPAAHSLIKQYYKGYIPSQVLLDEHASKVWSQIGETDSKVIQVQLDNLIK